MAHKDLHVSLTQLDIDSVMRDIHPEAEVERIFFEVAQELGLADPELMLPGHSTEQYTVVYDKFTPRRR